MANKWPYENVGHKIQMEPLKEFTLCEQLAKNLSMATKNLTKKGRHIGTRNQCVKWYFQGIEIHARACKRGFNKFTKWD